MAPTIERATEIDVWADNRVATPREDSKVICDTCSEPIYLRQVVRGEHWMAFDRLRINHMHEHNGRMIAAVDLKHRHRCHTEDKGD